MTVDAHRPRAGLLLIGLGLALALRMVVAGNDGGASAPAGITFAAALLVLVVAAGWRPGSIRPAQLALGLLGAAILVGIPLELRLTGAIPPLAFAPGSVPEWTVVIAAVALSEELLFRGALFSAVDAASGAPSAVAVSACAFALIHVPLYGWGALPLDLAVGVWLSALRLAGGSAVAPAIAHVLADLAAWWLV